MFKAYINDRAELTFSDMQEAARWQAYKEDHKGVTLSIVEGEVTDQPKKRTDQQNRAIHKYFELVATALNDAGYPIRKTLQSYKAEIDWSKDTVKEIIWRPAQLAITGKSSTTELNKQEDVSKVYETCNRFLAQLGVHVPFPTHEPGYYETAPLKNELWPPN